MRGIFIQAGGHSCGLVIGASQGYLSLSPEPPTPRMTKLETRRGSLPVVMATAAVALVAFGVVGSLVAPGPATSIGVPLGVTVWWLASKLAALYR